MRAGRSGEGGEGRLQRGHLRGPGGDETVLLVEDHDEVRQVARRILLDGGYTVLTAADAEEALALIEEWQGPVDALVSDVVMPRKSGPALASELVARFPRMKVLFLSGWGAESMANRGLTLSGGTFLRKPFTAGELLKSLRDVLDEPG